MHTSLLLLLALTLLPSAHSALVSCGLAGNGCLKINSTALPNYGPPSPTLPLDLYFDGTTIMPITVNSNWKSPCTGYGAAAGAGCPQTGAGLIDYTTQYSNQPVPVVFILCKVMAETFGTGCNYRYTYPFPYASASPQSATGDDGTASEIVYGINFYD